MECFNESNLGDFESYKKIKPTLFYFRGHYYRRTFMNLFFANILTFVYRAKIEIVYYIETYWLRFLLLVALVLSLCACGVHVDKPLSVHHLVPDTCVVDSQEISNHDYLVFYRPVFVGNTKVLQPFQILHSPSCYCRYNRRFIVVSRSKK